MALSGSTGAGSSAIVPSILVSCAEDHWEGRTVQGESRKTIAITMGDPAGIGPEICLRALADPAVTRRCVPVVIGDAGVLHRVAEQCNLPMPSDILALHDWRNEGAAGPTVVDCRAVEASAVRPGEIDAACGQAAFTYIEAAIEAALAGRVVAVATAPIHKEAFHQAGVPFPGHTELFATRTGTSRFCMLLASEELAVGFVTMHNSVAEISGKLSVERVLTVIELTADAVYRLRGKRPRMTVCGLNPHAGEHGLFGLEETEFIRPAIRAASDAGLEIDGPLPPDTAFLPEVRARTDAYVAMYHDQGHIPFKMLSFDTGVNITLGLPIVRTSVDHGTAFDIAWQGVAKPTSLVQAIMYAARLASVAD